MYRRRLLFLAAALFVTGGCEDASAPAGGDSTIAVRAYVDANGSGTFDSGDVPLSGLAVSLQATSGSETHSATTDAQGVATFTGVEPGSYQASLGGDAPEGAVLSSAQQPVLVAPFEGGDVNGEFRFAYLPGSISGVLYRDNNANGVFDAGVDTPAPGLPVTLFGASGTTALATTTTSASGAFTFSTLRPGQYRVVVTPLPTMTITGGDTIAVTVGPQAPLPVPVLFTGNLISTISAAKGVALGEAVAVEGVVTVAPGTFRPAGDNMYIQDATSGIQVFNVPAGSDLQVGDSVRVVGVLGAFNDELQIIRPTGGTLLVTEIGSGTVPAPRTQTGAQIVALENEGQLVRVGGVEVLSVGSVSGSTGSYNVTVRAPSGEEYLIRVEHRDTGIPSTSWIVGRKYDVIGVLGQFRGAAQVKPRSIADVELRSSATPIGAVRAMAFADSANMRFDTVTVEGVVHTAQGTFRTDNAFIRDATGGILLFNVPSGANLMLGDTVRVTAAIDWFNGELELVRFSTTSPPVIEKLGSGPAPNPILISGAQMLSRAYEGDLVRLSNVTVESVGTPSSSGGFDVNVRTTDNQAVRVRIEKTDIGLPPSSWVVGNRYNVVGALSHFRGVPQVKPRSAADVTASTVNVISIAAAEARPAGDTVIVEGVVIAGSGIFGSATGSTMNAYIFDGTAGIQVFGVPTALEVGDLVRVRGLTGVFSGEKQIARFSSTSLLEVTDLGTAPVPQPRVVTGQVLIDRVFEGDLVTVPNFTVTSVGTVSGSGGYNVTGTTADGQTITVRNDRAAVNIPVTFWVVGGVYDVTGIASAFNSVAQLKPRSPDDVVRR